MDDPCVPFDPEKDGLAIMEAQRELYGAEYVGGFAQLTTVWPDKAESRILKRWPPA